MGHCLEKTDILMGMGQGSSFSRTLSLSPVPSLGKLTRWAPPICTTLSGFQNAFRRLNPAHIGGYRECEELIAGMAEEV